MKIERNFIEAKQRRGTNIRPITKPWREIYQWLLIYELKKILAKKYMGWTGASIVACEFNLAAFSGRAGIRLRH